MAHVPGHMDRPKDPLARYTGPTTVGPVQPKRKWWEKAASFAGDFAYDVTGADNYMQAYRDLRKGNVGGALFNLAQGVGETGLLVVPGLATGGRAAQIAYRTAPRFSKVIGVGGGAKSFATNVAANAAINYGTGSYSSTAVPTPTVTEAVPATVPSSTPTTIAAAPQTAAMAQTGPVTTAPNGFQYRLNPVTGLNEVVGTTTVDPETGIAFRYNPSTGRSEAVGRTASTGEQYLSWEQDPRNPANKDLFPNLSAMEEEVFAKQIRDLNAETDLLIKELQGSIGAQRAESQRQIQRLGREGAGSSQDIASQMAELGIDTSPGQFDVTLEQIGQQTAEGQAAQRRSLANYISGVQSRIGAAERTRAQKESDIIMARQAAELAAAEEANQIDELIKLLGGS